MKTYYKIFLFAIFSLMLGAACSDDETNDLEFKISTESIDLKSIESTQTFHIVTSQAFTISSSETWCTVKQISENSTGTVKLELEAKENTTENNRTAVITITSGNETKQIQVNQLPSNFLILKKSSYTISAEGGSIVVEFQTNGNYEIVQTNEWIKQPISKALIDIQQTFIIATNDALESRKGTIDISLGNITETVTIIQDGRSVLVPADKTGMTSDAMELAKKMKIGWNLGNSLEATSTTAASETMWGNAKTSKKLIDAVKAAGFNTVRIPCAWSAYIVDNNTYKIDENWLARVKEVVDYCVDNNMYAIINIHWDGGWRDENPFYKDQEVILEKHTALWKQIAVYFRDYDEHLLFAGTNEVHAGYSDPSAENIDVQLSYNKTFVETVRATGGKNHWRNLIVQSYNTNIDYAVDYLTLPQDIVANRIMAEVHYYDPWDFAGDESSNKFLWGKYFLGNANASSSNEAELDTAFAKMKSNFVDQNIPVVLGEFGAILRTKLPEIPYANHIKSRNYYLKYVTQSAIKNGLVPVYWDNGNVNNLGFGLFDRSTGEQIHTDAIAAIVKSAS